jgi:hypothetical protein
VKRLLFIFLLVGLPFTGGALGQSSGSDVPATASEFVVAARSVDDSSPANPSSAILAKLNVWANLTEVMVKFPESPEAAEIRSGTSGLGRFYGETRKSLAAGLAANIFGLDSSSYNPFNQRAEVLFGTLLRLDLPEYALVLIDKVDYDQEPRLRAAAIDHFVVAGDLPRAKLAAGGDIALQDRVARRLLITEGPAAALQFLERLDYKDTLGLKIATLAALARGVDAANADESDRKAAADALARAKDIASAPDLDEIGPNAIVALAGLGLGEMAMRLAKNSDSVRLIVPAMLARGHFGDARTLALAHESYSDTITDMIMIAAAEAIQGSLDEAEATLAQLDQTKMTMDQRAVAFLQIGKVDDAVALSDGTSLEQDTWGEILAAIAARSGRKHAESVAAKHGVDVAGVRKQLALGIALKDPRGAIAFADGDANLLLEIADTLTARGNYAGAIAVLTATLTAPTPLDKNPGSFDSDIHGRLFDIELKLGDVVSAGARLPELWDDERLLRFLAASLDARLFDQAELAVERMRKDPYHNEPNQTDGWWKVAEALAAQQGTEVARKLLEEKLNIDPTNYLSQWVDLLAAAGDRFALINTLMQNADNDPTSRTIIEIAIFNLL